LGFELVSAVDVRGEQSGLLTRIATENASFCTMMKVDRVYGTGISDPRLQRIELTRW